MPQEQLNGSYWRRKQMLPTVGIDTLPDEVLARVLSLLPVREAVQTCVLARRWRHLWRSMPVIRIVSEDGLLTPQEVKNMNMFVNFFMFLRLRGVPLESFEIKVDGYDECQSELHISLWIQQALLCQARSLSVDLPYERDGFPLYNMTLISKHLTTLELRLVELKEKFLDFSTCLVLKSLRMRGCDISAVKISSRSLQELTICNCMFKGTTRTRISAPSLVWIQLSENTTTPTLESMPSLVTGFVRFMDSDEYCGKEVFGGSCTDKRCKNCGGDNGDEIGDCLLLKGLSKAENLELMAEPGAFIFKRDLMWCPTFSNLKTLLLNGWCVELDFDALICFLKHTPDLEKLTLQLCQAPVNWVEPRGAYIPSEEPFASCRLKVVEIRCQKFDERVHQISRMLSIYNPYIAQINIQWSGRCSGCKLEIDTILAMQLVGFLRRAGLMQ